MKKILFLFLFPFYLFADDFEKKYKNADIIIISHRTKVTVEDSGLSHVESKKIFKIQSETGANLMKVQRFDYDPQSSYFEVKKAIIHKKNGEKIFVNTETILDLPQPQKLIYWGGRMKVLSLKGLAIGDEVEIETYKKGFEIAYLKENDEKYIPPMRGHFYDIVLFAEPYPVKEMKYTLIMPKDKLIQYEIYNGELISSVLIKGEKIEWTWEKFNIKPVLKEKFSVLLQDGVTKLVLTTIPTWEERSKWFYEVNEKQFEFDEEILKKTQEITKGLKTDEEKIAALLHWVAQEIRYTGISMGKGEGYTIHSAKEIFRNRFGVCKDIAGMLITMLRAAGYETYAAMTMAYGNVERIPADQFNHCVVARKKKDGTYQMLDPTWAVFSRDLWSKAEGLQYYLIGTQWGETLTHTPSFPPEDSKISIKGKNNIMENGDLSGEILITAIGYTEDRLRRWFASSLKKEEKTIVELMLNKIDEKIQSYSYEITNLRDFKTPFTLKIKYRIKNFATVGENILITRLPLSQNLFMENERLTDYYHALEVKNRTLPVRLFANSMIEINDEISLPANMKMISQNLLLQKETENLHLNVETKNKKKNLIFNLTFKIKDKIVQPEKWEEFSSIIEEMKALKDKLFIFEIGGREK